MADAGDSDEALMQSFAGGDGGAFETLYRRHESRVYRFLCRQLGDRETANDLMQEIWFAVARHAARYEPRARFTTWLYTLARHRVVDVWRSRRPALSLDEDDGEGEPLAAQLPGDPRDQPERRAESAASAEQILAALARLPDEQREAFLLRAEAELSVEEIAEVTGTSFETAKSRLRYARGRLRELLAGVAA
ncbi:MAG: RNA polymerase sigma factor [Proteobacteria bacterium]|nr:RNA polymerase sigma factor [Pseudomonadota bacterium]